MALDERASPALPVSIEPPDDVLGPWAAWRAARRDLIGIIPRAAYHETMLAGGGAFGRGGPAEWIMVMDPAGLDHVLRTKASNYPRSPFTLRILKPREGDSLFTADEETWRWQHRAMTPVFNARNLAGLAPLMTRVATDTTARIAAQSPGPVDLYPEMVRATADVICDAALSGRESLDRDALAQGISEFLSTVARVSLLDILGVPTWVPRPSRLFDRSARRMDDRMDAVVQARQARGPSDPPDLLDLLINARDPGDGQDAGRGMDPISVRNNLLAFIIAGHETTALALTWALYLLAWDESVQERARAEVLAATDGPARHDDLAAMPFLRQVLEEALRLYPPAGLLTKGAVEEDEILGIRVRPGTTIMLPIWAIHRHRKLWDAPDDFDPDRFAPAAKAARNRSSFLPFSAGPHFCIGMNFALMEAQIILASLLRDLRFRLVPGFTPEPRLVFTLRPANGMLLDVARIGA